MLNTAVGDKGIKISGGKCNSSIGQDSYSNSEIIILDEATSSLDVNTENKILKTLKKLKIKQFYYPIELILKISIRFTKLIIQNHMLF